MSQANELNKQKLDNTIQETLNKNRNEAAEALKVRLEAESKIIHNLIKPATTPLNTNPVAVKLANTS